MQEHPLVEHGVHVRCKLVLLLEVALVHRPGPRMHTTTGYLKIYLPKVDELLVRRRREMHVLKVLHLNEVLPLLVQHCGRRRLHRADQFFFLLSDCLHALLLPARHLHVLNHLPLRLRPHLLPSRVLRLAVAVLGHFDLTVAELRLFNGLSHVKVLEGGFLLGPVSLECGYGLVCWVVLGNAVFLSHSA